MSFHFNSDLTQLQYLSEKLSSSNLSDAKRQQLTDKITKKIQDLKIDLPEVFTPLNPQKLELSRVLQKIEEQLATDPSPKAKELCNTIAKIKDKVDQSPLSLEKTVIPRKEEVGLQLAFFLDFNGPDVNGYTTTAMLESLDIGMPFVATHSLLDGQNVEKEVYRTLLRNMLISKQNDWDIFIQKGSENRDGLVLFLPKSLHSDKTPQEKLKLLDFNTDGSLQPAKVLDVLSTSNKTSSASSLTSLFNKEPTIGKAILLQGHGDPNSVAGIGGLDFENFRTLLDTQKVKGLMISSCHSGGASSFTFLDDPTLEKQQFDPNFSHAHYPILVRSVGDFVVTNNYDTTVNSIINTMPDSVKSAQNILAQLPTFLENAQSYKKLTTLIDKEENIEGQNKKILPNYLSVHLPSTPGVPQGLRVLSEQGGANFALTMQTLRKEVIKPEVFKKHEGKKHPPTDKLISLKNPQALQFYPQTIPISIEVSDTHPILLSMVPGNAHHYVQSLKVSNGTLDTFLKTTEDFYTNNNLSANKAFFIGHLTVGAQQYQEVIFGRVKGKTYCAYKEGERYFRKDGDKVEEISPFTFELLEKRIVTLTVPSNKALRAATAGLEKESDFTDALKNPPFNYSPSVNVKNINTLSQVEKGQLVANCLFLQENELALELLKNQKVDPHSKDITGWDLFGNAAWLGLNQIIEYSLEAGADIDNLDGFTLFQIACRTGNEELVKNLLKNHTVDVTKPDPSGWPPIVFSFNNPAISKILIEQNPNLNLLNKGISLISQWVKEGNFANVVELLNRNVDLTIGDHSPLYHVIKAKQPQFVKVLMEKGCDPFKSDNSGLVPVMEAVKSGALGILKEFLTHPNSDVTVTDKNGSNLYLEALKNGNREIIELLKERGAKLPLKPSATQLSDINRLLGEYITLKEFGLLTEFLFSSESQHKVTSLLLENNPELLLQFLMDGKIDPNIFISGTGPLAIVIANEWVRTKSDVLGKIVHVCAEKLEDPGLLLYKAAAMDDLSLVQKLAKSESKPSFSPIAYTNIISKTEGKVFRWLVEQKLVDLNRWTGGDTETLFLHVIKTNSFPLFEFCLQHGAEINAAKDKKSSPLAEAAELPELKIFEQLLALGADINAPAKEHQNVLAVLASKHSLATLRKYLADYPVLLHAKKTDFKATPLEAAASRNNPEGDAVFRYLVEEGADLNDPGFSDYHLVNRYCLKGSFEVVALCFAKGLQLRDNQQKTAMTSALNGGNSSIIKLLAEKKYLVGFEFENNELRKGYQKGDPNFIATLLEAGVDFSKINSDEKETLRKLMLERNDQASLALFDKAITTT